MTMLTPTSASCCVVNSSLLPNSVMLARIGTSTAARIASNSLEVAPSPRGRSRRPRHRRAPWRGRSRHASPSTARMSVRAMMRKFGSRRASTAARMRLSAVSSSTTALPSRWPQRFGLTWSSMCSAGEPGVLERPARCARRSSARRSRCRRRRGRAGRSSRAICWRAAGDLGERGEADVGQAEVGARARRPRCRRPRSPCPG